MALPLAFFPRVKFFLDASREGGGGYLQEAPDHIPSEPLLGEPVYPLYGPVQPDIVAHGLLFQMHSYWKSPVLDERGHPYKKLQGDNKQLLIVPGAVHTDLYDNLEKIPFDQIEAFFRGYLK